jgi:hypothetical protein
MTGSISLRPAERKSLLDTYRGSHDPALRLRAHLILLLAQGHTWATNPARVRRRGPSVGERAR